MVAARCIYLFGDQTGDFDAGLRHLFQARSDSFLASFLERCYRTLRREIARLPPSEQRLLPRFASIVDLSVHYQSPKHNPALESALACIYQFGWFINYYGDLGHSYPSNGAICAIGLCTGLLCSAAVSSSRSIGDLIPAAAETVAVAFRLGACVSKIQEVVVSNEQTSLSWSILLSGMQEKDARRKIDNFSSQRTIPLPSRLYISAVSSNGLTISGPPKLLDQFTERYLSNNYKPRRAPIYGPYHAPHLYDHQDVERILEPWPATAYLKYRPLVPVLSSNTGKPIKAESFQSLLKICVEEILLQQLRWDNVVESCLSMANSLNPRQCNIFSSSAITAQSICMALKGEGISSVNLEGDGAEVPSDPNSIGLSGRTEHSKIAIIGLSGRFPDAPNLEEFWNLLYKGLDVHREVPRERWDVSAHVDMTGSKRNTSKILHGCWISDPGFFDPRFFNMSPREALHTDPAQRLALLTAHEALEMAGLIPNSTPSTQRDRVGIFFGMTSDDYRETNSGQDIDTYFITGGNRAFTTGRINYYFKFSGPSVSIDTACSSSLAAIHIACNSIWKNDCDTAIAGGANVLTNPDNHAGLDRGHFLSKAGNCNTFDDEADGYCRADGVGTVVLKRLEDAQADNDNIYGVIAGIYTNHSAESVSMTRPHVGAQACIFNKLLSDASVDPKEVSYIEMHGTGTQAGDAVEMQSVLNTFAPDHSRGISQRLHLGSAKADIGHGESASGVTSLIKVLLMMQKNAIPPHCGIKTRINRNFPIDLGQRNVHIALEPTPWERPLSGKRIAFINNFSAAGGNTALLLEDAPVPGHRERHDPRPVYTVVISAKSRSALKNNVNALLAYIYESSEASGRDEQILLADLSYTTTARRIHHPCRATAVGSSLREIKDAFTAFSNSGGTGPADTAVPCVGFVFTGQGVQYAGIGKQLYENCQQFRATIQRLDRICQNLKFPSVTPLVDGSVPVEHLNPITWKSLGLKPSFVLGHSLGEYAAMSAAGLLTASDALYLCGTRAQLLTSRCQAGTHSMLAVRAAIEQVRPLLNCKTAEIACINSPTETVVCGSDATIKELSHKFSEAGWKTTKLTAPFAFHSAQMDPILVFFGRICRGITFNRPSVPFVSTLLCEVITESNFGTLDPCYMARHCRETVNFLGALKTMKSERLLDDRTVWVEIGAHPVCSGMVKATFGPQATTIASIRRDVNTWKVLSTSLSALYLSGIDINWNEYYRGYGYNYRVLPLPPYSWDLKNYWIPYANNFCLSKGRLCDSRTETAVASTFLTPSAQEIVETHNTDTAATVVVQNNIADPNLDQVIQGHKVNGIALCPSSLYADIAHTLSTYLVNRYKPCSKDSGLDICNMIVSRPLVANGSSNQLFRALAIANWNNPSISVEIYSVNNEGQRTVNHASCLVRLFDRNSVELEWKRVSYLIKRSIDRLQESADNGKHHRIKRGMVYKLFRALVDYDENYKSIEEVILDSDQSEATARVKFQALSSNFHVNPFWIDSLGHLSGFVMNASDSIDSRDQIYINHGWDSMRCTRAFSSDITYRTYVRMQPWQSFLWAGDVYIFDGEDIVAVFGGIKFQQLARKVLDTVLPHIETPSMSLRAAPLVAKDACQVTRNDTRVAESNAAAESSLTSRALEILAQETGLDKSEMTDDLALADCGIDSLLSLTVAGRFREELDVELESSAFIDCPTIMGLKRRLSEASTPTGSANSSRARECSFSSMGTSTSISSIGPSAYPSSPIKEVHFEQKASMGEIRSIIGDEIGSPLSGVTGEENLRELGMDSLLSLAVLERIRKTLGIDVPSDFSLENQTFNDIETALGRKPKAVSTSLVKNLVPAHVTKPKIIPPATSVLLQGNPKTAIKTLFLFPDGSGSATSYASLPGISSDVCVYGLNCPFMRTPENFTCSLDKLTAPYIAEIRRRQPKGPYNFGGWSAGGISAYDAAYLLVTKENELVDRLFLLDSPFPVGLEKLPPRLYSFLSSAGFFGDSKSPPKWLLPHFLAFIDALDAYRPLPMPHLSAGLAGSRAPKTYLAWAKDGVCGKPGDLRPMPASDGGRDPEDMTWLLDDRTDLGPNKWDSLTGKEEIAEIVVLEGANHFSMMKGEKAAEVSSVLGAWIS